MDNEKIVLEFEPRVSGSAYKQVDNFSRHLESRLGKSIDELDGEFVKLAKNRAVEIVRYGDRIDAIAYNLTKGGKDGSKQKISSAKTKAPYLLGASLSKGEAEKILKMGNQEFNQIKHIATISRKRQERLEGVEFKRKRGVQFSDIIKENLFGMDLKKYELSQKRTELRGYEKQFSLLDPSDVEGAKELKDNITKTRKEMSKLQKEAKPSEMKKSFGFFNRLGSFMIFFRAWMRILSDMGTAVQNLTDFSPEYKEMFSSVNSDITKMAASIVSIAAPLMNIFQPVVRFISDSVANIASGLSKITAVISGQGKYLKVNKDYYKEINEEANKLSFDKFEALSGQATQDLLIEEQMSSDEITSIVAQLTTIGGILIGFASYKIVDWVLNGGIKKLTDGLGKVTNKINDISNAGLIAGSAFAFITSIFTLIDVVKNWDSASLVTKISAITSVVLGLAAAIMTILALTGVGSAKVMKAVTVGLTAGSILASGVSAMKFADGGIPAKGSLFIAGEAGAELIHTMPSGQTGVTNIDQFTQAMINANYQSSGLFQTLIENALNNCSELFETNIDGAAVARSKSFKNEINRTNSGLNIK